MPPDSEGSTIIDTLSDGSSHATTTLLPRVADTLEERETEEQHPPATVSADPDATTQEGDEKRAQAPSGSTSVAPAQTDRRYGLMVMVGVAAVVAIVAIAYAATSDHTVEPTSTPAATAPPTVATGQPKVGPPEIGAARQSAADIVQRASRNAELDAQIAAKEQLLEEPSVAPEPDGAPEPDIDPERDAVRETRPPAQKRRSPAGSGERPERQKPAPTRAPQERPTTDFSVTPLDELE